MPEQVDIVGPAFPDPGTEFPVGVVVARGDEDGDLHPLQGPVYAFVALPGVGAVENIAGEQHQVAALPDADLGDLPGHFQQAGLQLPALEVGEAPQGGIDVPVGGVQNFDH